MKAGRSDIHRRYRPRDVFTEIGLINLKKMTDCCYGKSWMYLILIFKRRCSLSIENCKQISSHDENAILRVIHISFQIHEIDNVMNLVCLRQTAVNLTNHSIDLYLALLKDMKGGIDEAWIHCL